MWVYRCRGLQAPVNPLCHELRLTGLVTKPALKEVLKSAFILPINVVDTHEAISFRLDRENICVALENVYSLCFSCLG